MDVSRLIDSHDFLFITLDTLRYDVAERLHAAGRTPPAGARLAARRLGETAQAWQLHFRRPRRLLCRFPADAGAARPASAALRPPLPRQRNHHV